MPKRALAMVILLALGAVLLVTYLSLQHGRVQPTAPIPINPPAAPATNAAPLSLPDSFAGKDREFVLARLRDLERQLGTMNPGDASRTIHAYLTNGTDTQTGLGLVLNSQGELDEAPTFRTWLLDKWHNIDPAAAAAYSRSLLETSNSPDEWALALRNIALEDGSTNARELLQQKFREMLNRADWRQNPSSGFLEAFDLPVFLGETNLVPELGACVRDKENPALAYAGFLAIDRLLQQHPAATLAAIQEPTLLSGREETRANFFARADVRQPDQRLLLENYLLTPSRTAAELEAFAGVFPNANFIISHNLLTQAPSLTHQDLIARDEASLNLVRQWLRDPRFAGLKGILGKTEVRLADFVRQTQSNRAAK